MARCKSPITNEQQFAQLWCDTSLTINDIAEMYGVSRKAVRHAASKYHLGCKPLDDPEVRDDDPTPEEIRQRCEEIQKGWPEWRRLGLPFRREPSSKCGYIATIEIQQFTPDRIHGGFKLQ